MDEFGDQIVPHCDDLSGKIVRCEVMFDDPKEIEARTARIREMNPYKLDVVIMTTTNQTSTISNTDINKVGGLESAINQYVSGSGIDSNLQGKVLSYLSGKI